MKTKLSLAIFGMAIGQVLLIVFTTPEPDKIIAVGTIGILCALSRIIYIMEYTKNKE